MDEIRIGSIVNLWHWRSNTVKEFEVTDIFFERYISGFKTIVKAKYYSPKCECWFEETFFDNDFFKYAEKASLMEAEND